MDGGAADDSLTGGPAADTLKGLGGDDTLSGLAGSDLLVGGDGDDRLDGGSGDDVLHGQEGSNTLNGGAGDDLLAGGSGNNLFNGGADFDIVSFATQSANLTIRLEDNYAVSVGGASDTLIGIEGLVGGLGDDSIIGGNDTNWISGAVGDDTLSGTSGLDTLLGGTGDDHITGGDGDNWIGGGTGDDEILAGRGQNTVHGGRGSDAIDATGGGYFTGDSGDDHIAMISGLGPATILGGAGNDHVMGFQVSAFGGVGDDDVSGAGRLAGGVGDDILRYAGGNTSLDGGAGFDTAVFKSGTVDLRLHESQQTSSGSVTLHGIEGLKGSFDGANLFIGNHSGNMLDGAYGADTLMGMGGGDTLMVNAGGQNGARSELYGGAGDDRLVCGVDLADLHGGEGADTFVFFGQLKRPDDANGSMIMDLKNEDVIDLSHFSEYGFVLVDQFDGKSGELQLVYDKAAHITWLEGTTDSDPDPELLVGLAGRHKDFSNFVL